MSAMPTLITQERDGPNRRQENHQTARTGGLIPDLNRIVGSRLSRGVERWQ
jgi:hypothetical protein